MFKKIIIPLFVLLVIAAIIFFKAKNSANTKDNDIKLVKVQRGDIIEKALAIGRIEPEKEVAVKSKISGIVKRIYAEVGDEVKAGEPLLEINPDPTPLEFAEAKRNVEIASVNLDNARNEYERVKKLLKEDVVSQKEFDSAENSFKELELRLNLAQERLALIDKGKTKIADRQIDTIIKSPVDGMILERRIQEGDSVVPLTSYQAGTELIILADMNSLIFKGTVDEIDVGKLREGMTAELKIGAIPDQKIFGKLTKISPKARMQENATLFDVEIEIIQKGEKVIRAGYSANADLVINKSANTLFLPERLVEFKEGKAFIEVKNEKSEIVKKEVKVGLSDGINIEILEGLKEGEEVVERPPKQIK
jgi:HlyD family secretion protein